jgi:hypothetical protein
MNLLNPRQIELVLTSRLPGFKVSCTSRKEDVISLCIRDMQTREIFGVSGIRPSAYKGRYGALILAKLLMEDIHGLRTPAPIQVEQASASPAREASRDHSLPEHQIILSLISNQ